LVPSRRGRSVRHGEHERNNDHELDDTRPPSPLTIAAGLDTV
jgi:hypothetical protein